MYDRTTDSLIEEVVMSKIILLPLTLPFALNIFADNVTNFSVHCARLANLKGFFETSVRVFNLKHGYFQLIFSLRNNASYEVERVRIDFANAIGFIEISMHALVVNTNIQVHNISFF